MEIVHNKDEHKFEAEMSGEKCALNYMELGEKIWNFVSMTLPEDLQGRKEVEEMVKYAIEFVKEHDIKILVNCSDVQDFLIKHKDLKDLVYHPY